MVLSQESMRCPVRPGQGCAQRPGLSASQCPPPLLMLLILILILAAWLAVTAVIVGVCLMATRGDSPPDGALETEQHPAARGLRGSRLASRVHRVLRFGRLQVRHGRHAHGGRRA